jgi:hypothetical protein
MSDYESYDTIGINKMQIIDTYLVEIKYQERQ